MYHHFGPGRYGISRDLFQQHCRAIADLNNQDGSCSELEVTFDDGRQDVLDAASDLEAVGLKGRFFITTGWLGRPGHLSSEGIKELQQRGHLIGLHGHTHRFLRGMGIRELNEELQAGLQILTSLTGTKVEEASLPGGRYDVAALHVFGDLGIKRLWTSQPGHWRETFASLELKGRDLVGREAKPGFLVELSRGRGDRVRSMVYAVKSAGKLLIGDGLYHKMTLNES